MMRKNIKKIDNDDLDNRFDRFDDDNDDDNNNNNLIVTSKKKKKKFSKKRKIADANDGDIETKKKKKKRTKKNLWIDDAAEESGDEGINGDDDADDDNENEYVIDGFVVDDEDDDADDDEEGATATSAGGGGLLEDSDDDDDNVNAFGDDDDDDKEQKPKRKKFKKMRATVKLTEDDLLLINENAGMSSSEPKKATKIKRGEGKLIDDIQEEEEEMDDFIDHDIDIVDDTSGDDSYYEKGYGRLGVSEAQINEFYEIFGTGFIEDNNMYKNNGDKQRRQQQQQKSQNEARTIQPQRRRDAPEPSLGREKRTPFHGSNTGNDGKRKPPSAWGRRASLLKLTGRFDFKTGATIEEKKRKEREARLEETNSLARIGGHNRPPRKHLGLVTRRACAHPAFRNAKHDEVEKELKQGGAGMVGEALIRPSSKVNDTLAIHWVVKEGSIKIIEAKEEGKDVGASIGNLLKIKVGVGQYETYGSIDELLGRYIAPMNDFVEELTSHRKFIDLSENKLDEKLRAEKSANPNAFPYNICWMKMCPGYASLRYISSSTLGHHPIGISPNGFVWFSKTYSALELLLNDFKKNPQAKCLPPRRALPPCRPAEPLKPLRWGNRPAPPPRQHTGSQPPPPHACQTSKSHRVATSGYLSRLLKMNDTE